ncbi:MAG: hypothetical protein INQ03_23170 [Candidatus Heimdallarchaeota archaeon]|nr:hypothetical protein [Candidatus Heimdallarchaeota archaeon]
MNTEIQFDCILSKVLETVGSEISGNLVDWFFELDGDSIEIFDLSQDSRGKSWYFDYIFLKQDGLIKMMSIIAKSTVLSTEPKMDIYFPSPIEKHRSKNIVNVLKELLNDEFPNSKFTSYFTDVYINQSQDTLADALERTRDSINFSINLSRRMNSIA